MSSIYWNRRRVIRRLSLAVVWTIGVGIGSNAAVHGFVRGLLASAQAREAPAAAARVGFLLTSAAAAVLVVACATVAGFLLARATARAKETAIRSAIGATRRRLMTQFAWDGALAALAGGAVGLVLAFWTIAAIPAFFFAPDAEQLAFAPDYRATLVVAGVCMVITLACSLVPLVELWRDNPARVLQRESLGTSRSGRRIRRVLVVAQTACCCALTTLASITLESFSAALQTSLGHRAGASIMVTVEAAPRLTRSELTADGPSYFRDVEQAARAATGAAAAAWVVRPPGSRPALQSFRVEAPTTQLRDVVLDVASFTSASLIDVVVPPIAGRMFGAQDTAQSCRVAIVNEEAARVLLADDAIGLSLEDPAGKPVEIVGVVRMRNVAAARSRGGPKIYYYAQQTEVPAGREGPGRFRIPERSHVTRVMLDANSVSPAYFGLLGAQRLSGAIFGPAPAPQQCRVAMIDQAAADAYFPRDAVGGALIDDGGRRATIIGVMQSSVLRHWQRPPMPTVYFPHWQDFTARMTLVLPVADTRDALVASAAQAAAAVPGGTGDIRATTLEAHLTRMALAPERISALLVAAAAAIAFVLGTLGVYGIVAESTRQQRREIALRFALGAQNHRIVAELLTETLRLGGAGAVAGTVAALVAAPWLAGVPLGVVFSSVAVWISGPAALIAVVAIATVLPAWRALSVDVHGTLRN